MKRALITGITGQDGSYLAEFLLEKGYSVHGIARLSSTSNLRRISHLEGKIELYEGDLSDTSSLKRVIEKANPDEVYNLAAMSHVKVSFGMAEYTADIDGVGVLRILEAIKAYNPRIRFYQASTSELFGQVREVPQSESTPFYPRSPYGVAKLYAYWIVVNYREAYGLYACNGILFNHESPRRGESFVSRKITLAATKIASGFQDRLLLGNLDAKRDWGYARDFVEGMWLMLQQKKPEDFVLSTGRTTTVRKFVEMAFLEVGIQIRWQGTGLEEKGVGPDDKVLVEISPQFFRPTEVDLLIGDSTRARNQLGWTPKTSVEQLVQMMIRADQKALSEMSLAHQ